MTDKLKFQSIHDQIKEFKEKMNKKPIHRQDEDMVMNANFNQDVNDHFLVDDDYNYFQYYGEQLAFSEQTRKIQEQNDLKKYKEDRAKIVYQIDEDQGFNVQEELKNILEKQNQEHKKPKKLFIKVKKAKQNQSDDEEDQENSILKIRKIPVIQKAIQKKSIINYDSDN